MNTDFILPGGNAGGMKILWENPAPDAQFSAQTISVPGVKKYKYIVIGFRGSVGPIASVTVPTNLVGTKSITLAEHVLFSERNISINDDQVTFNNAVVFTSYGQASSNQNNNTVVPLAIFGIG